jgi:multicomponent Na+:H+ antiporter subunit A
VVITLLGLHLVAALAGAATVRRWGARATALLGLAPALALAWLLWSAPGVLAGTPVTATAAWVPELGLELAFRVDALALLVAGLVAGVGVLVLVYAGWYFAPDEPGTPRAAGLLVGFAGAMLGLVTTDNLLVAYGFWELTTVCSFLLIGHHHTDPAARRAARLSLLVTVGFGVPMLVGFVLLGTAAGTYRISALVADPPRGPAVTVAVVLVLAGAFAKSAQWPLHAWLPAAMVAPTPVSAYLHAAAMVKAGVYLVARLAPGFSDVLPWRPLVLTVGLASLLVGGWRALRQDDLKRLLAFGTISQLGLLMVLVGAGTRTAALAGAAMLLAHGLFKAPLFLAVGVLDRRAGGRRIDELTGLARRMPVLFTGAALATASMVGLPPLLGYLGKEAAYEAFLTGGTEGLGGAVAAVVLAGVAAGSVLTVAYGVRFLLGGFGGPPNPEPTGPGPPGAGPTARDPARWGMVLPVAVLALAGLVAGGWSEVPQRLAAGYAAAFPAPDAEPYRLALWHGPTPTLALSALVLVAGLGGYRALSWLRRAVPTAPSPAPLGRAVRAGLTGAVRAFTARTQVGSLPAYLVVVLVTLLVLVAGGLVVGGWPAGVEPPRLWHHPAQPLLAVVILAAAVGAVRARRRLTAVLLLAGAGYGVGGLFVVQGAPDLALTLFLVESLSLIVLILVLRRVPERFPTRRRSPATRLVTAVASLAAGGLVAVTLVAAAGPPGFPRESAGYLDRAAQAGGENVVNLIIVDFRALDTLGEIAVLTVTALGVAGLVRLVEPSRRPEPGQPALAERPVADGEAPAPEPAWLADPAPPALGPRSVLLSVVTRVLSPTVVLFSVYLLFAGHHRMGGGFVAGLVAGIAYTLRYVAGGPRELRRAARTTPAVLLGGGLLLAAGSGVAGWLAGGQLLESALVEVTLPLVGTVSTATSVGFDIAVYVLVLGVVHTLVDTLGAGIQPTAPEAAS